MKHLLIPMFIALIVSGPAWATIYVCDTKGAYEIKNGKVVTDRPQQSGLRLTWPKVVFDDVSGQFKYGKEGRWTEEKMVVTSKGSKSSSASGHYKHNGTIFSAIVVYSWRNPIEFQWSGGGNSDLITGTCKYYGNL
jgi:hypothetical protein